MRDAVPLGSPWKSAPRCLFLFGAGASYGAGQVDPASATIGPRAPLGVHLFAELRAAFPRTWGVLDPAVVDLFRGGANFEAGMGEIAERNDYDLGPLLVDLGIYFSRFRPREVKKMLYSELIYGFSWAGIQPVFATLNYECLLQICVRASDYQPLQVLPLHGSCNLLPAKNIFGATYAGNGAGIFEGRWEKYDPVIVERWYRVEGHTIPPVMRVYAAGKPSPVCPSATARFAQDWRSWVLESEHLIIIGASPSFQDAHVWDPVLASRALVYYVGGKTGDFGRLSSELGNRMVVLGDTFDGAMNALLGLARRLTGRG